MKDRWWQSHRQRDALPITIFIMAVLIGVVAVGLVLMFRSQDLTKSNTVLADPNGNVFQFKPKLDKRQDRF